MVGWLPASALDAGQPEPLRWVSKKTLSSATVQRGESNITQAARQPADRSRADVPASAVQLRWRGAEAIQAPATAEPAASSSTPKVDRSVIAVSGILDGRGVVKFAVAEEVVEAAAPRDAFADPFGDATRTPAPPLELPAFPIQTDIPAARVIAKEAADSPAEPPLRDPPDMSEDDPIPALPQDPTPRQDPEPLQLPEPQQLPEPAPGQPSPDSQPLYKTRDCRDENQNCREALNKWQRDALSKISLDITPSFNPDERDPDRVINEEADRDRTLAKAPVRTWRDRQGGALGTGRLNNIQRGSAMILDNNNQIITFRFDQLCDDDLCFVALWWGVPTECTLGDETYLARYWQPTTMTWKASGLCHKPLYFEEMQLERYGHMTGPLLEPVVSGAHFFVNLATLPYQAGINPPWECQYALGYYRPGNCAPWLAAPIPLSVRGGLLQAGAIVGGVYLFP
jgi:hypothetical protein